MHTNLIAKIGKVLLGLMLIVLIICSASSGPSIASAQEAGTPQPGTVATITPDEPNVLSLSDGTLIERHGINGPSVPPPGFEEERQAVALSDGVSINGMADLPGSLWVFGCSATAAADIAAIYDQEDGQNEYPNIYTGSANDGEMPLGDELNLFFPIFVDSTSGISCPAAISDSSAASALDGGVTNGIYQSNTLVASMQGVDGRTSRGSIDDYWISYNSAESDPYTGSGEGNACPLSLPMGDEVSSQAAGWPQHAWGDAIGDYMFTSQSAYHNVDGETAFYNYYSSKEPLTCDVMESQHLPDGTLGRKNFYEARGYAVTECYNQPTDNTITGGTGGFSFDQYKAEIDAGRPVMLGLDGHSIVGVGYNGNMIRLHDGWDYETHEMVWGGSYADMALQDVSIVNLAPLHTISGNTGVGGVTLSYTNFTPKTVTSDDSGNYSITISAGWDGTVTPSKLGYAFTPESISYTDVTADMSSQDYAQVSVPIVTSIVTASDNPTNATSVDFTVMFSEPVTGVDTADFKLTNTILTGASVTDVTGTGSGPYTVVVNTGTGNGTIRLDVPATATIQDLEGNYFFNPYTSGETYTVYKGAAPTVPVLVSPANNALVTSYQPTLDWNNSSEVMALTVPSWHYEINVTSPSGYNLTDNTVDNADPLVGLGASQYIFTAPLPANTTFTWKVRAYNDANQYSAWSATRTFRTMLATPVLISPVDDPNSLTPLDNKRPTFEWSAVPGATSYTLQILNGTKVVVTGTITAPLHVYTPAAELLPSTTYTWKVKANGTNAGVYSDPFTFTTSSNPPKVPVLTLPANAALVDGALEVILKWNPVAAVTTSVSATTYPAAASFQVEYATNSAFTGSKVVSVNGNTLVDTQLSLSIGTLSPNLTYSWRVRSWSAIDAAGNHSVWSAARTFRTKPPSTLLATPELSLPVNLTTLNNKRPTFSWSEVPGVTTYTLQILKGTTVVVTGTIKPPLHTYTPAADLLPSTEYTWKVKANGLVSSDYSAPSTFTTSLNTPNVPVLFAPAVNALVDSAVPQTLDWNPVLAVVTTNPATSYPAAASYDVEYATNSTFVSSTLVNVAAPDTQYLIPSLLPANTTFYWRVRASNITGQYSAWSATRIFKTRLATPILNLPANGSSLNNKRPTFEWDEVLGATTYTLQILKGSAVVMTGTITPPAYTYTPTVDLLPSTTYTWKVKANGANAGNYSVPFTFTTSINPPKTPILSAPASNALLDSAAEQTLKWSPVPAVSTVNPATNYPGAASFEVEYATNSAFINSESEFVNLDVQLTLPIGALVPNRTYYWHVRAWSETNTEGNHSAWSASRTFRTSLAMPVLKEPTDGHSENNKRPTFVWDEVPGATSYTLQIWNVTKVVNTGTIIAPLHTYTPAVDLPPGTSYSWMVKANGANTGYYSAPFTFETGNPPAIPVLFAPANAALLPDNVAQILDWNPVPANPEALSFEVEYATNSAFTDTIITPVNSVTGTQLTISTLPGRTYYWRVRSWSDADAKGDHSVWSLVRTINVKFVAPTLTTPADGATAVDIRPTFTWASTNGLWTNYTLQVANNSAFTSGLRSFTITAPTTTYTIPNTLPALTSGTKYWRVKINGLYTPITSDTWSFVVQ